MKIVRATPTPCAPILRMTGEDAVFAAGLRERIADGAVTAADAKALAQALRPYLTDEDGTASWISSVASEWCRAVDAAPSLAAGATSGQGGDESGGGGSRWHKFTEEAGDWTWARGSESPATTQPPPPGVVGEWQAAPLQVVDAAWTFGDVAQSSPFPAGENVISITFSCNVPLGPMQVQDGAPAVGCCLRFTGLAPYAPQEAVPGSPLKLEGSAAEVLAAAPDADPRNEGVWEAGGSVCAYLRGILAPNVRHTIGLCVRNPVVSPSEPPVVTIEADGCVRVRRTPLPLSHAALRIAVPGFHDATIRKSSAYPGTTNQLTVSFSTTVDLEQTEGGGALAVIISGLTGSPTPDSDEFEIEPDGDAASVISSKGRWRSASGVIEVPLLAQVAQGRVYSFSFSLCNPPASLASAQAQPAIIAVSGGPAIDGRVLQLVSAPARGSGEVVGAGGLRETDGEVHLGWYNTFSGHLRSQYPHLYDPGGGDGAGDLSKGVVVGVSSSFVVTASIKAGAGGVLVRWERLGAQADAAAAYPRGASVYFVQIASLPPSLGSRASLDPDLSQLVWRTAYAGPEMSCLVSREVAGLSPAGWAVRMREELVESSEHGKEKLITSPWSAPCLAQDGGKGMASGRLQQGGGKEGVRVEHQELRWSAICCGRGVRLSSRRHSMRRDGIPGWGGVLGELGFSTGRHAWKFAFQGRVSHVMVGIARAGIPLDAWPGTVSGTGRPGGAPCILWSSDGLFSAFGLPAAPCSSAASRPSSQDQAVCIEGDCLSIVLDLGEGWVEFSKGAHVLRRIATSGPSGAALDAGEWFPVAFSGGACTIALKPYQQ